MVFAISTVIFSVGLILRGTVFSGTWRCSAPCGSELFIHSMLRKVFYWAAVLNANSSQKSNNPIKLAKSFPPNTRSITLAPACTQVYTGAHNHAHCKTLQKDSIISCVTE